VICLSTDKAVHPINGIGLSHIINVLNSTRVYESEIIGECPELEKLKKAVKRLDLSNRVVFIPYIDALY
jgi:hypothetical protein